MKVLLFHPVRLPPPDYGGVERVVLWLAKGLTERGHAVSVAALPGSVLPRGVTLVEVDPARVSALDLLAQVPAGTDVIHFMAPPEAGTWERLPCPGLLTVHGNGKPGEVFPRNSVFLSRDHARRHGATVFVHNGIDPGEYQFRPTREKSRDCLFLSRTSWRVKNLAGAIRICQKARTRLRIAGGHRPVTARLLAALTPGLRWEGPVGGNRKAALLAEARALIFPVLWPEPFGLVVAEALMSGTPVFASRLGSLPELVRPEVGELLPSPTDASAEEAWIAAVSRRDWRWEAEACRAYALERFHFLRMAADYEALYKRLTAGESLHADLKDP